jgi:hypothetical protein
MEPLILIGLFAAAVFYFHRRDSGSGSTSRNSPAPDGGGSNDTPGHCGNDSCDGGDGGGD